MAALNDTDMLVSSDGLVAHSLSDATTDISGINPAAGTASEQFQMVAALLRAYQTVQRASVLPIATRILTASISYLYRGQSSESGPFIPQYLVGVRHSFTLSNGDVVTPGDAFRMAPSQELEPDTDTDVENASFRDAMTAFDYGAVVMKEPAWQRAKDATERQIKGSIRYSGLWYTPGAVPVITQFTPNDNGWRPPAYVGRQIGIQWALFGDAEATDNTMFMMNAAQDAWTAQTGKIDGLFMPVFYFDSPGSTLYGPANTFGWNGPFNSQSMYEQLSAMRDAVRIATQAGVADRKAYATAIATRALKWFGNDRNWIPSYPTIADAWTASIRKSMALGYNEGDVVTLPRDVFTVPDTLNTDGTLRSKNYNPGMIAVALTSAIMLDRLQRPGEGTMSTEVARVIEKCVTVMEFTYVTSGTMAGTFSPDPANNIWQSRWHADLIQAVIDLYNWCGQSNNRYTTLRAQARVWLNGLLDAVEGLAADPSGGFIYGRLLWPLAPDWSNGVTESFEYSTQVITSDSGKEQRLAKRVKPRRQLSYRHTLGLKDDAVQYQAILRKRQWRPMLVPQWHMAKVVGVTAKLGAFEIVLDSAPPASWSTAKALYLVSGDNKTLLNITRVTGNVVTTRDALQFDVPRGSELMTVNYGLINNNLSSTRAISTVLQAQVAFDILPQTDTRDIPAMTSYSDLIRFIAEQGHRWARYIRRAAALDPAVWPTWPEMKTNYTSRMTFTVNDDERMVITRKPNWISAMNITDTWEYDLIDYVNSAVTPGYAEDAGRRTFQAQWSAFTYEEVDDIMSVFGALRGAQVACWVPSWSQDLTAAGDMLATNRLRVEQNAIIDEGILLNDPSIAIMVETFKGAINLAVVTNVTTSAGVSTLTLDRDFVSSLKQSEIMKISLMYRVRMASDTIELTWHVKGIAELQASFITVQE